MWKQWFWSLYPWKSQSLFPFMYSKLNALHKMMKAAETYSQTSQTSLCSGTSACPQALTGYYLTLSRGSGHNLCYLNPPLSQTGRWQVLTPPEDSQPGLVLPSHQSKGWTGQIIFFLFWLKKQKLGLKEEHINSLWGAGEIAQCLRVWTVLPGDRVQFLRATQDWR